MVLPGLPFAILLKILKFALGPPRHFPLDFFIKFELKVSAKWSWSLWGSFLYISLVNVYSKSLGVKILIFIVLYALWL